MDSHDNQPTEARQGDGGALGYPTGFGRGWIPCARDIGLPGEAFSILPVSACGNGEGDRSGPSTEMEGRGVVEGQCAPYPSVSPCGTATSPSLRDGEDLRAAIRHDGWTPVRKAQFLDHLARHGNVRAACAAVGLSPEAAYKARRREGLFAQGWSAALVLAREHVGQVLADRALNGVTEPIFYRGEQVGARVRFDSRLLLAHLARLDALAEGAGKDHAARFDELVAVIVGLAPEADMLDAADGCEGDPDPELPATRARFAESAARRARFAARCDEEGLWGDGDEDEDGDDDGEGAEPEPWERAGCEAEAAEQAMEQRIAATAAEARVAAQARWDGWFAQACAVVDGVGVGVVSLPAPPVAPVLRQAEDQAPAAPHEFKSLDRVTSVNFAAAVLGDNALARREPRVALC